MKLIFITSLISITLFSFSQEHSLLFDIETIQKNNVLKVLQYDPTDSVEYFQTYPNGFYSYYDIYGRIIVFNGYAGCSNDSLIASTEFRNIFIYDSLDNKIGFVSIYENLLHPINFLSIKSFDSETNKVKTASRETTGSFNSKIVFSEEDIDNSGFTPIDSIFFSDKHIKYIYTADTTYFKDVYINQSGQIDSSIYLSLSAKDKTKLRNKTITYNEYYTGGKIKTKTEEKYSFNGDNLFISKKKYFYFENGLIDIIKTNYSTDKNETISKFIYFYNPD